MILGKRSDFDRKENEKYYTPYIALLPLLPWLPARCTFVEPCAGDGRLIRHLEKHEHECIYACDLAPEADGIEQRDVLFFGQEFPVADFFITNPPWKREEMHQMIDLFRVLRPTWLLFDADWMHTRQAKPFLPYCHKIVSVGRVSWEGNGTAGKDNCAWYLFDINEAETRFIGR